MLINSLEFAKNCEGPFGVLHVLTKKGRGIDVANQQPEKFHGTGPYDVQTGASPVPKTWHRACLAGCVRPNHGQLVRRQLCRWHHRRDAQRDWP